MSNVIKIILIYFITTISIYSCSKIEDKMYLFELNSADTLIVKSALDHFSMKHNPAYLDEIIKSYWEIENPYLKCECFKLIFQLGAFKLDYRNIKHRQFFIKSNIDSTIYPIIDDALTPSSNSVLIINALIDISMLKDKRYENKIINLLGHDNSSVRLIAASELSTIGTKKSIDALLNVVKKDSIYGVINCAIESIEELADSIKIDSIIQHIDDYPERFQDKIYSINKKRAN